MPEGARKSGKFVAVCAHPDYSWTPVGGQKVLVPYMIACDLVDSTEVSPNVNFTKNPVFLYRASTAPRVEGNEPGVGDGPGTSGFGDRGNGGLLSKVTNGTVWVEQHSESVHVNGIQVVRDGDECWMNHRD
jgi:hypothetical protein